MIQFPKISFKSIIIVGIVIIAILSGWMMIIYKKKIDISRTAPILFISKTWSFDYHKVMLQGIQKKAKKYGINVEFYAPEIESDYISQINRLENILSNPNKQYSGIIVAPNHRFKLANILQKLGEHGYKYVIVDAPITMNSDSEPGYCGFVGTDNYQGGKLAAEYLARNVPKGNIVVIQGLVSHQTGLDREAGFMEKIREYPALKIIARISGDWNSETAYQNFSKFMTKNISPIDAIFGYSDPMTLAVAKHFKGNPSRPFIIGYNGDKEAQQALLNGEIDATVAQTPELMGDWAVDLLFRCIERNERSILKTPVALMKVTKIISTQK